MLKLNIATENNHNNIYMGIDQSMTHTGYTIIEADVDTKKVSILDTRGISTISDDTIENRILHIKQNIFEAIDKYKPGLVRLESLAFRANTNNGRILAGLFFVLITALTEKGIPYEIVNIKTLKKFATDSGSASKEEMRSAINSDIVTLLAEKANLKDTSKKFEDIVDSFWLSVYKLELEV